MLCFSMLLIIDVCLGAVFTLMCVQTISILVRVNEAEFHLFGKELFTRLTLCSSCELSIYVLLLLLISHFGFEGSIFF